jgi:hypothetical protein
VLFGGDAASGVRFFLLDGKVALTGAQAMRLSRWPIL